jgi:methyl-accepting chemotaxis protein
MISAADGIQEITNSIQQVRKSALKTSSGINEIQTSSNNLAHLASTLQKIVNQFKI